MINIPFYNLWETELCAICTFSLFQLYSRLNVSIVLHAVLHIHHSMDIWNNGNILIFNIYYHTHRVVEREQTHVTFSHRKLLVWQYETTFSVTINVSTMRHISLFEIFFFSFIPLVEPLYQTNETEWWKVVWRLGWQIKYCKSHRAHHFAYGASVKFISVSIVLLVTSFSLYNYSIYS